PSFINPSRAAGGAAITSNVSPALIRPTNSELRPVITLSLCPELFSNSGPISVNTVQMARDAKIFSSAEHTVPCDMHANSVQARSETMARDLIEVPPRRLRRTTIALEALRFSIWLCLRRRAGDQGRREIDSESHIERNRVTTATNGG